MTNRIFALALAAALAACGGAAQPGPTTTTAARAEEGPHACPMAVPGARANVVDVVGGVAIDFTSTAAGTDAEELARRVHQMHDAQKIGALAGPGGGRGRAGALRAAAAPQADVRLENISRGVRVVLLARDQSQVAALRARARRHVPAMNGAECERAR